MSQWLQPTAYTAFGRHGRMRPWLHGLGQHSYGHSYSRMPVVKQVVSAVDEVDVGVVVVRPSVRPCLHDFEVVSAVGEARTTFYHVHVADCEVMFASEALAEMFIRNPVLFPSFCMFAVLILPDFAMFFFSLVAVLILGNRSHRRSQQK
jgi:hypothetical protein